MICRDNIMYSFIPVVKIMPSIISFVELCVCTLRYKLKLTEMSVKKFSVILISECLSWKIRSPVATYGNALSNTLLILPYINKLSQVISAAERLKVASACAWETIIK